MEGGVGGRAGGTENGACKFRLIYIVFNNGFGLVH